MDIGNYKGSPEPVLSHPTLPAIDLYDQTGIRAVPSREVEEVALLPEGQFPVGVVPRLDGLTLEVEDVFGSSGGRGGCGGGRRGFEGGEEVSDHPFGMEFRFVGSQG